MSARCTFCERDCGNAGARAIHEQSCCAGPPTPEAERKRKQRERHRPETPATRQLAAADRGWREDAACRDKNTAWWFPEPPSGDEFTAYALTMCRERCPVRAECETFAVSTRQEDGIYGGKTGPERERERKRRQRAARAS